MEPEEFSYYELHEAQDSSWFDGFTAGKAEVLDTLLVEASELIQRIDDDALILDPDVQALVDLLNRWIESNEGGEEE